MNEYEIYIENRPNEPFKFTGVYVPELETQNWIYCKDDKDEICHFRKNKVVAIFGIELNNLKADTAPFKSYKIYASNSITPFVFEGRYRRDLEQSDFHFYEKEDGFVCCFNKKYITVVFGDTEESIIANRIKK